MSEEFVNLKEEINSLINKANDMEIQIQELNVKGMDKLKRRIIAERKFLTKLNKGLVKKEQARCSNLHHLESVLECVSSYPGVTAVLQPFTAHQYKVEVDIIADNGNKWIKAVARNPQALHTICAGASNYGGKTLLDHCKELIFCANHHRHLFKIPQVCIRFSAGVSSSLSKQIESQGISVEGDVIEDGSLGIDHLLIPEDTQQLTCNCDFIARKPTEENLCLNLDVTAMIAHVSSLTNGGANFSFKDAILKEQASWERMRPVKTFLENLFADHCLLCCETAAKHFQTIVETMGGRGEKDRMKQLMNRITVVPDQPSSRTKALKLGGKIKDRSVIIFGTGDELQAPTVTANSGFLRSAERQGLPFAAFLHESRSLTEQKENETESL